MFVITGKNSGMEMETDRFRDKLSDRAGIAVSIARRQEEGEVKALDPINSRGQPRGRRFRLVSLQGFQGQTFQRPDGIPKQQVGTFSDERITALGTHAGQCNPADQASHSSKSVSWSSAGRNGVYLRGLDFSIIWKEGWLRKRFLFRYAILGFHH